MQDDGYPPSAMDALVERQFAEDGRRNRGPMKTPAPAVDTLIADTRRICEAATPGPWKHNTGVSVFAPPHRIAANERVVVFSQWEDDAIAADCDFIAHSRTALPSLCDALEQSLSTIRELRDAPSYDRGFKDGCDSLEGLIQEQAVEIERLKERAEFWKSEAAR